MVKKYIPIRINPGENPAADSTNASASQWTATNRVRFYRGFPESIGGWESFTFDDGATIDGCVRRIYSQVIGSTNVVNLMIGTHTTLYSLVGSQLTNVTPQETSTTAIANSLDSDFVALANDPIDTVLSSTTLTINETGVEAFVVAGDTITIAGSGAVNGVPAIEINASHVVRTITTDEFTITVATAATSTGSGGGASVTRSSGIVTVNATAHALGNGERVTIAGAVTFAGLTSGNLNAEHIIRNVATNTFDIVISDQATSSVSGGGGASTTFAKQIADGECDPSFGRGYGVGKYGVGKYGVSKTSTSLLTLPRIYSFARFGTNLILTPGEQTGVFTWDGDITAAPAALSNAPTAVNLVFVSDNIVVTFGDSDVDNRVKWSDQGVSTFWDVTDKTRLAGEDDIEGANKWLSQVNVRGINLLFTTNQVYTMRFIGLPFVWEFKELDTSSGIIAQNARAVHNGVCYFMGTDNFYLYAGGSVQVIPNNTIRNAVYDELNSTDQTKVFAWVNEKNNEIWFHYPTGTNTEPDKVAIYSIEEGTWWRITLTRTASEAPYLSTEFPQLTDDATTLFRHEKGVDDDTSPMNWSITSPVMLLTNDIGSLKRYIPDSTQTEDITVKTDLFLFPQLTANSSKTNTVTPTTDKVDIIQNGRYVQYTISQNVLGGEWRAGEWLQEIDGGETESRD